MPGKTRFQALKHWHKHTLEKAVEEKKADAPIVPLCSFLASTKNFFTSSSCSGRIVLIKATPHQTKKEASIQKQWHSVVGFEELWKAVQHPTDREELWMKQEPFILHIGARDIENAKKILSIMKKAGVKRGGIMLAEKEKFLLEITGTHALALPIKRNNVLLVSREYLELVLQKANTKMLANQKRLEKFEETCRKELE